MTSEVEKAEASERDEVVSELSLGRVGCRESEGRAK